MKINAEFDQRVVVHSEEVEWIDSPMPGVSRRPLDRIGEEVARATSIVRYAPGSHFSRHVHTGGEEFVVLDGVFQDEHGDFPVGSYIRNPPQSSHTPGSEPGCVIFVKLWQFEPQDPTHIRLNTRFMEAVPHSDMPGVSITPLYADDAEQVTLQHWEPDTKVSLTAENGFEVLVLEGDIEQGGDQLRKHSWLRLPIGSRLNAKAGNQGAKVWIKQNHLNRVDAESERVNAVNSK